MVFRFFSRGGPVLVTFQCFELGALLEPAPAAGAFRTREVGGAPGLAESGMVFSSTWRSVSAKISVAENA
jgi:hypothetical protein